MAEQWFYRMFGEDFGPVPFEQLRVLVDQGTVGADDDVRATNSTRWVAASSVEGLGLMSPAGGVAVATTGVTDMSMDVMTGKVGLDDWYCKVQGREQGPLKFDELLELARKGDVGAEDQVKLGAQGKWRRVGSIGRLVAVLPYQQVASKTPLPATKSPSAAPARTPAMEQAVIGSPRDPGASQPRKVESIVAAQAATAQAAYEQAKSQAMAAILQPAEAAFKGVEGAAHHELAWAFAPHMDPAWWCWVGGVEYGPVGFMQIFELVRNGQLQPTDFIRNGLAGQYFPSASAPGLFNAFAIVTHAAEVFRQAQLQAQAAADAIPAPPPPPQIAAPKVEAPKPATTAVAAAGSAAAPAKPGSAIVSTVDKHATQTEATRSVVAVETKSVPTVQPMSAPAETKPTPATAPAVSASSSGPKPALSSSGPLATPRPAYSPPAARPSKGSSTFDLADSLKFLKDPPALAAMGVLALLLAAIFGWQYLPKGSPADLKHFQTLKQVFDEIQVNRLVGTTDFTTLSTKGGAASQKVISELAPRAGRENKAQLALLWAARDELPRVFADLQSDPAKPGAAEENFVTRLREAAQHMGLKDRGGLPGPRSANDSPPGPIKLNIPGS